MVLASARPAAAQSRRGGDAFVPVRGSRVPARGRGPRRGVEHLTNAEIAERLLISVRTVESHVCFLLRKRRAGDRRELVAAAPSVLGSHASGAQVLLDLVTELAQRDVGFTLARVRTEILDELDGAGITRGLLPPGIYLELDGVRVHAQNRADPTSRSHGNSSPGHSGPEPGGRC
jgi:hypothetical protein